MKKTLFKIMFWVVSLTWGLPMTLIGLIATPIVILFGGHPHKNGCSWITEIAKNWGGLEMGAVAFCGNYSESSPKFYHHVRCHEFGHAIQNLYLGPFFLFVVGIPSACRYWYQTIAEKKGKEFPEDWYDEGFWAEKNATKVGTKLVDWLEEGK